MKKSNPIASAIKSMASYIIFMGIMFLALGFGIAYYPQIITITIVSFFLFVGVLSLLFGAKILFLYARVAKALNKIKFD